jgi:hypothetical protein
MAVDAKSEQIISWFFKKRSGGGGFYRGWRMEGAVVMNQGALVGKSGAPRSFRRNLVAQIG